MMNKAITRLAVALLCLSPALGCSDSDINPCNSCVTESDAGALPSDSGLEDAQTADAVVVDQTPAEGDLLQGPSGDATVDAAKPIGQKEMVTAETLNQWIADQKQMVLLDVREVWEFDGGHIADATNYPWTSGVLQTSTGKINGSLPVVVYCQSGMRSSAASKYLVLEGFGPVYDLQGGISAWKAAGFAVEK